MKSYTIILAILITTFYSCRNAYEKENGEIESLNVLINNTEEVLNSIDTSKVFSVTRDVKKQLWNFSNKYDTISKEDAFKVADYYGSKKSIYYFYNNYSKFVRELEISRKQLENLKQDINNSVITREQFAEYYKNEQELIMKLNNEVTNATSGIESSIDKLVKDKEMIMEILSQYRKDSLLRNE